MEGFLSSQFMLVCKSSGMLRFLAVIFLGVSACSFFAPANLQTKRSTDLESRGIKRIAVVLPSGRVPEQASSATYASTPPEKGPSEEELAELLGRFVYSAMSPEARAREGIFLAFQYPVEIPGISTTYFLKAAVNAVRKHRGLEELDAMEFLSLIKERIKLVEMDEKLINRPLNEGFSGGEKKRNEILQMAVLDPKLAILDETDSGLDIDALRIVANGVNALRRQDRAMIVITHYQRLLNYIVPDFIHVLHQGRIIKSGTKELALELEVKGYDWIKSEASALQ